MATTALFAEILVVGLETTVWLSLVLLAALGMSVTEAVKELAPLKDIATPLTAGALALAYVLGVLVDRVSDSVYTSFRADPNVSERRLTVMLKNAEIAKFLEYQRSRLRIARGTVVNVPFAVLAGVLYLCRTGRSWKGIVALLVAGVVVFLVAWFAAEKIHSAYMKRLSEAYDLLTQREPFVSG